MPPPPRRPTAPSKLDRRCIAIIGDIVSSKRLQGAGRDHLQQQLKGTLDKLNKRHHTAILSKFIVTAGDEFQGLLCAGAPIPDIVWATDGTRWGIEIRFGIGCGRLDTRVEPYAIGMDGPVWHTAREAVRLARAKAWLGGVFRGFGDPDETILNGLARSLHHTRRGLTDRQFAIFEALRQTPHQTAVAKALGITRQAISKQTRSTGWDAYREGEAAWRLALQPFDYCRSWRK